MVYGDVLTLGKKERYSIALEATYLKLLNESIDMDTGEGGLLHPVFIVLSYCDSNFDKVVTTFVKTETYWHSAISFGPSLKYMYSFNYGEYKANPIVGGLSFENIEGYQKNYPDADLYVACILLDDEKYKALQKALRFYIVNKKKTRYDFPNILRMHFTRKTKNTMKLNLVCSTFIDTILKYAGIDLNQGMVTNLVRPDDLIARNGEKQFKVFDGKVTDYNPIVAKKLVEKMVDDRSYEFFDKSYPIIA